MRRKRRTFNTAFKTKEVLEALKERQIVNELAEQFEVHPNLTQLSFHSPISHQDLGGIKGLLRLPCLKNGTNKARTGSRQQS